MRKLLSRLVEHLTFAQRFLLASFVVLLVGMVGVGIWVEQQIEIGVIHNTAATTALYVDSFIAQYLQELATGKSLSPDHVAALSHLVENTPLGEQILAFKVWDGEGRVLYSIDPAEIGQVFPVQGGLANALKGRVTTRVSDLNAQENADERPLAPRLLETYSPVRLQGTNRIIAVAEFYQSVDALQSEITASQQRSWLVVGAAMIVMYLLLALFVRQANNTILRQQGQLSRQVTRLEELLTQNEQLGERVRRAAARTAALNERFLRRISAEIHDGPAQDLGLALLRLDTVAAHADGTAVGPPNGLNGSNDLDVATNSVRHALQEMRAISSGMGLPQLDHLSIAETVTRVVRAHERRTGTKVAVEMGEMLGDGSLPVKITLYRVIQEALNNSHRHARDIGQRVRLTRDDGHLLLEIADEGPGFDGTQQADWEEHLGLAGMRERVESLGGLFNIESQVGHGTRVIARLPLQASGGLRKNA